MAHTIHVRIKHKRSAEGRGFFHGKDTFTSARKVEMAEQARKDGLHDYYAVHMDARPAPAPNKRALREAHAQFDAAFGGGRMAA